MQETAVVDDDWAQRAKSKIPSRQGSEFFFGGGQANFSRYVVVSSTSINWLGFIPRLGPTTQDNGGQFCTHGSAGALTPKGTEPNF